MHRILLLLSLLSLSVVTLPAQAQSFPTPVGTWEGAVMIGPESFLLAFTLSEADGVVSATFTSKDMGVYGMPADSVEIREQRIIIKVVPVDGQFDGRIRLDENGATVVRIDGDWFQESEMLPLVLTSVPKPTL